MKIKATSKIGLLLMKMDPIKICIVDDEDIYFSPELLAIAKSNGYGDIERMSYIDADTFKDLTENPRDIIILDIQGIASPDVAKDGLHIADSLSKNTASYIVITSAHKFHLNKRMTAVDFVIEDRILTAVDFLDILNKITENYLSKKTAFYKKIFFKVGFSLIRQSL